MQPERLQLFKNFANNLEGKNAAEILMMYKRLMDAADKQKPITQQERSAIVGAIKSCLPDAEQAKFNGILKLMNISA